MEMGKWLAQQGDDNNSHSLNILTDGKYFESK
jgi:hypothetical protein